MTQRRRGFTLIELLVVMGIMVLLIAILLPAVSRAHRNAVRNSMQADLIIISQALDTYKHDFGDYPRSGTNPSVTGDVVLCWALVAPGGQAADGADGPGFRIRLAGQGQVYGPYVSVDRFVISNPANTNPPSDSKSQILDRYGNPILYWPANLGVSPSTQFVGAYTPGKLPPAQQLATFNFNDNPSWNNTNPHHLTKRVFQYKLGNHAMNASGAISPGETPITTPYLLWTAGPDGQFGPETNPPTGTSNCSSTGVDDDVTNVPLDSFPIGVRP